MEKEKSLWIEADLHLKKDGRETMHIHNNEAGDLLIDIADEEGLEALKDQLSGGNNLQQLIELNRWVRKAEGQNWVVQVGNRQLVKLGGRVPAVNFINLIRTSLG